MIKKLNIKKQLMSFVMMVGIAVISSLYLTACTSEKPLSTLTPLETSEPRSSTSSPTLTVAIFPTRLSPSIVRASAIPTSSPTVTHQTTSLPTANNPLVSSWQSTYYDISDGEYLLYWKNPDRKDRSLHAAMADGSNEHLYIQFPDELKIRHSVLVTSVSPDGKRMVFVKYGDFHSDDTLFFYDTINNSVTDISEGTACRDPQWSPSGMQLIASCYIEGVVGGEVIAIIGESERITMTNESFRLDAPQWSPDGQWIAYFEGPIGGAGPDGPLSCDATVHLIATNCLLKPETCIARDSVIPVDPNECFQYFMAWSPDNQSLAFWNGWSPANSLPGIQIVNLATGNRQSLLSGFKDDVEKTRWIPYNLSWSPDGQWIAFNDYDNVYLIPLQGGEPVLFVENAGPVVGWIKKLTFDPSDVMSITPAGHDLNLRDTPSIAGTSLRKLQPGDTVTLLEGPIVADGYTWWKMVTSDGLEGWAVEVSVWYESVSDAGNGGIRTTPTPVP